MAHYPENYGVNWGVANVLQSSASLSLVSLSRSIVRLELTRSLAPAVAIMFRCVLVAGSRPFTLFERQLTICSS